MNLLGHDISTLLGKLGAWPGDLDVDGCVDLFNIAINNLHADSLALDIDPVGGRTTVILCAAAYQVGAKVSIISTPGTESPAMNGLWMNRAVKTFNLKTVLRAADVHVGEASFALVRPHRLDEVLEGSLIKSGSYILCIGADSISTLAGAPEKRGPLWSLWTKPSPVVPDVGDPPFPDAAPTAVEWSPPKYINGSYINGSLVLTPGNGAAKNIEEATVVEEETQDSP